MKSVEACCWSKKDRFIKALHRSAVLCSRQGRPENSIMCRHLMLLAGSGHVTSGWSAALRQSESHHRHSSQLAGDPSARFLSRDPDPASLQTLISNFGLAPSLVHSTPLRMQLWLFSGNPQGRQSAERVHRCPPTPKKESCQEPQTDTKTERDQWWILEQTGEIVDGEIFW